MDVISHFAARFERTREEELSIEEYLAECKRNRVAYASAAERMLQAIGEPLEWAGAGRWRRPRAAVRGLLPPSTHVGTRLPLLLARRLGGRPR